MRHSRVGSKVEEELQKREADRERGRTERIEFSGEDTHCIAVSVPQKTEIAE